MIPCMATNMTLNDGDIVVTESRTNFNRGKMEGSPFRTHIPITGKYKKAKEEEPILRAGYAFGDPLCMKEVGSPVFREDTHQRTLLGLVQGPIAPQNQCPTRLFNIVDVSFPEINEPLSPAVVPFGGIFRKNKLIYSRRPKRVLQYQSRGLL